MTRLGIDIADANAVYKKITRDLTTHPEVIYTHFATADEGDLTYAKMQLRKFNEIVELADKHKIKFKYVALNNE